jgi:hypothetical protein
MSKTLQFIFKIGTILTDVTSIVLRDPTNTYGIQRNDTSAAIVAAGTALTHLSTGLYAYTFTEPQAGLNYDYWLEYEYAGNTKRLKQTLETVIGNVVPIPAQTTYAQMGIDTVACGDATLSAFLSGQANLIWAMQARRGVALDLQYQYYVSDLVILAMDHVRMLIDLETGSSTMTDAAEMNALNTSSASSSMSKTRSSSFTESSQSAQNWSRTSSRTSSSSSRIDGSNSATRNGSSSDTSTVAQSSSGSSIRTQSGASLATGDLDTDGTSGKAASNFIQSTISTTVYEGGGVSPSTISAIPSGNGLASTYESVSASALGLISASWANGAGAIRHKVTPTTMGRINAAGGVDTDGAAGDYATQGTSSSQHARSLVGSQTGSGSSTFLLSGTRQNNRVGSSTSSASSSTVGNSSSSLSSAANESQLRTASSLSHSESAYNSTMAASSTAHRESAGSDAMAASGATDREYYSQIYDSIKQMWEDTQEAIRSLESKMLITTRYLVEKLTVATAQSPLVGQIALPTLPTLTQRPGVYGGNVLGTFPGSWDKFVVR